MKIFRSVNAAQGALDRVSADGVRGWCASSPAVSIRVNGQPYFSAFCHVERRDVQAALGIEKPVGFNVPLRLALGDMVEVAGVDCQPLPGSPQRVGASAWLPVSAAQRPAFAPLEALLKAFGASHFKPFFKRSAELTAVALRGNNQPDMLVKLAGTPAHIADIKAFYRQVIEPHALPAPGLIPPSTTPLPNDYLIYRYVDGASYSAASQLSDSARQQVIQLLATLHAIPGGTLKRENTQQPYWQQLQRQVLRQALATLDIAYIQQIFLMRRLAKRLPTVLSHGDLHAGNVLVDDTEGALALIDWDRWGALPVGYDEACFLRGLPFQQALAYLPEQRDLRLGFAIISFWLGVVQNEQFRATPQAKEIMRYIKGRL